MRYRLKLALNNVYLEFRVLNDLSHTQVRLRGKFLDPCLLSTHLPGLFHYVDYTSGPRRLFEFESPAIKVINLYDQWIRTT